MSDAVQLKAQSSVSQTLLGFFRESYLGVAVLAVVLMIIIPLPGFLLNVLLIFNLLFSLLILLIVVYSAKPTEISLFPTLLLVSTIFGLALNISTTRAILDENVDIKREVSMINSFAELVTAGSTVIGFIIFIIIIAVQIVVITKGATRVSEVAARFTLDSMQVKMMAVETEYSSGAISEEEAKAQKAQIQRESDFYGSMDGASKFISGNVKISVLITVINILGGYIMNRHMENAFETFIKFAIGDGLLSQLPALLISTAMGIVVTRAAATGNLSEQVLDQIFRRGAGVYWICAGVLAFLGFIGIIRPGTFPWYILFPMAALVGFHAYRVRGSEKRAADFNEMMLKSADKKDEKPVDFPPVVPLDALSLELGYGLVPLVEKEKGAELLERVQGVRRQAAYDLGLVIPKVRIIDNSILEPSEYCFKIKGVDSGRGKIRIGYFLCINPGTATAEIQGEKTVDPAFGLPAIWIEQEKRDEAERSGYTVVDPPSIIATHLTEIIRRSAAEILGLQDTQAILDTLRKEYPAVVDEALREGRGLRVTEVQKIFHGLLRERVSIRNLVSILEAVAEFAPVSKNIPFLVEKARQALASQICYQYADEDRKLRVLTIDQSLEQRIIDAKYETASGVVCALDPPTQKAWIKAVVKAVTAVKEKGWMPVILCSEQARYLVKNSTDRELPDLAVLSVPEIVTGVIPEAVGMIRIEDGNME